MEHAILLPAVGSRSEEVRDEEVAAMARDEKVTAMARDMQKQRLDIKEEQIRGVELSHLLGYGARLFADGGAAAKMDPEGTFALSSPVSRLDCFVSHAWRSSRIAKWAALCSYFNLHAALSAYLLSGIALFVTQTLFYESIPAFFVVPPQEQLFIDNRHLRASMLIQIGSGISFALVFAFGHLVFRRGETAFLGAVLPIDHRPRPGLIAHLTT